MPTGSIPELRETAPAPETTLRPTLWSDRAAPSDEVASAGDDTAGRLNFGREIVSGDNLPDQWPVVVEDKLSPETDGAASVPPASRPDAAAPATPPSTILHLAGGGESARDTLRSAGFDLRGVSGTVLTALDSEVRYFHPADRQRAEAAVRAIGAVLRDYSSFEPTPPEGRIEVVIADTG